MFYSSTTFRLKLKELITPSLMCLILLLVMSPNSSAQSSGSISGKIIDNSNNEELIGANVLIIGTNYGASSDIDGQFSIKFVPVGKYTLKISYISYQTVTVESVEVKPGEDTKINISLDPASTELEEVVVTAEALKTTETSVLKIQKNSSNIVDGVSSELISKNNSTDGTDVLKRMSGVTITDGKYAFVRGVSDRYNNTLLNGASLPSTDPEKKSFSYDIFPANLIENLITAKTFSPDKPGDFSGGLIQINTIEFPSDFTLNVSASTGFNTLTSFKNYTGYSGGKTDFYGIDDGTRDYPSIINDSKVVKGNFTSDELNEITTSFKNNWNTTNSTAPLNGNIKLSVGDKYELGENILGYVASFNYSSSLSNEEKERNFYDFSGPRYNFKGNSFSQNIMLGGMLNLSYKFAATNKISLKNVFNQNADDETTIYTGDYRYADQYREITSLRYVSRSLLSNQLIGEHQFDFFRSTNIDWAVNYSRSTRNEPDARRYVYARSIENPTDPLRFQLDQSLATRYYGNLDDQDLSFATNFTIKPFEFSEAPSFKFGLLYDRKDRNFEARSFGFRNIPGGNFQFEDSVLQQSVDQIFAPENINSTFIEVTEITKPSDSYDSNQKLAAGYLMFDANVFEKIRIASGVRLEYSNQILNSESQTGTLINVSNFYRDWLPSLNLTYGLTNDINLRFAFSTTLSRPEFRELAPFSYFDFISNELVQGNPDLQRSLINNYDLRFELYPSAGELAAVSLFYKNFKNPIEEILLASSSNEPIRSFANVSGAKNYGVEFEIRKSLAFITSTFDHFSFVGNLSLISSSIVIDENNNVGFQKSDRALQGQADYIFNLGLYYDNYESGFSSSLVYNKVGQRIAKVGTSDLGDIIEKPVDLIDINFSQKVFEKFSIKLSVKDLLNQDRKFIQQTASGDQIAELRRVGRNISLGFGYQL
ncbi:MAG: TonB-dependent receptor [Ignavibacteriales bacterium]|nr:TonB-dependent receptor [Ignavibacteriales bacterium]